jgi:RHS repeat-associated protein
MLKKIFHSFLLGAILIGLPLPSIAQGSPAKTYIPDYIYAANLKKRETLTALDENLFGDQMSLQTGTVSFEQTDIVIDTNSSLKLTLGRKSKDGAGSISVFGDWMLNVPYMQGVFDPRVGWNAGTTDGRRCTARQPVIYGPQLAPLTFNQPRFPVHQGTSISLPGAGTEQLTGTGTGIVLPTDGRNYYASSKSGLRISCGPMLRNGAGEGFLVAQPDGTTYRFDWMLDGGNAGGYYRADTTSVLVYPTSHIMIFATQVTDRFGNKINYHYDAANPTRLLSVVSSEGARIDLQYDANGRIVTAVSDTRAWTYTYNPTSGVLTTVQLPDGSAWKFSGNSPSVALTSTDKSGIDGWLITFACTLSVQSVKNPIIDSGSKQNAQVEMVHPSGARGVFNFKKMYHGMSNHYSGNLNPNDGLTCLVDQEPLVHAAISLVDKTISGPGMSDRRWTYEYDTNWSGNYYCQKNPCRKSTNTNISKPDGSIETYTYGNEKTTNLGQLLNTTIKKNDITYQSTTYEYVEKNAAGQPFPASIGGGFVLNGVYLDTCSYAIYCNMPLKKTTTQIDGVVFTHETTAFDHMVRPLSVRRSNSLGYSKTDIVEYHDDLAQWVVGQVKRQYNVETGVVMSQTDYNAQALPWKTYSFGKLQQILNYWPDGNLSTVTDGRNNTTTLGDYYRGIPRLIGYPATPEAPAGATLSATVDPNGWITSVTNEIGAKTCYGYDAMGRLASILYPSETQLGVCDTSRWSPVSLSFVPVNYDEHGLPAGHWRASRYEGNKHVNTYYDAMWRPVLEEALDASNIAGTLSQVVKKYDAGGRLSFQSYPASNVGNYWDVAQGTRSFYDALDRVTRVEQDSEQDVLVTTTDYWPNLQIRVVNPRSQATVTAFMAWDQPMYDLPIASVQPEGKVIEIARHPQFGWPLQLKQRNAGNTLQQIRKYVYDGNAQLCKTIEPETGATVTGYDAANNPAWSASGLTGGDYASTAECSYAAANASGRVVNRTYDNRNRLKTLLFPDGRGNQVWNYEPDGQPKDITTFNDPNNATPVVNGYAYNKRRMLINEYSHQPGWYTWGLGYEYDSIGNLRWQSYPTGLTVDYAPNALGQPTGVRDQNNKFYASGASYYPNGAMKQFTYGNGIVHTMTQNARQLPSRVSSSGGVSDFGYSYDQNANVSHIWDYARDNGNGLYGRWMTYDGLDRLTSAGSCNFGGDCWHRFSYDALDNIKSWKLGGVKDYADYVYEAGTNRLTSIRNTAGATVMGIDYDPQGNLRNKNGQAYDFDYGNRLRGVTLKEYYRYDGLGRRVLNWRYPTASIPNGAVLVSQYSQSGQLMYQEGSPEGASEHIYLAGSLIATRNNGASKYQHTDALGSPVAVTNEAGTVIERNDYEPYGAVIGQPNKNGIGYTGHMMDGATGLTYMQQRYYDQSIGRFLSVDPVTANAENGSNFNRYKYASNNPYKFTDPDGRMDRYDVEQKNAAHWQEINKTPFDHLADYFLYSTNQTKQDLIDVGNAVANDKPLPIGATIGVVLTFSPAGPEGKAVGESGEVLLGSILRSQANRIQQIADRYAVNIEVIGSRARGNANELSDWDYVITGGNSRTRSKAYRDLPAGRYGGEMGPNGWTGKDRFDPKEVYPDEPRVRFEPSGGKNERRR